MAPISFAAPLFHRDADDASSSPIETLRTQWTQPADVFSVLLLLGGDLVNKALAQLAGGTLTPVTLSFGMSQLTLFLICWRSIS